MKTHATAIAATALIVLGGCVTPPSDLASNPAAQGLSAAEQHQRVQSMMAEKAAMASLASGGMPYGAHIEISTAHADAQRQQFAAQQAMQVAIEQAHANAAANARAAAFADGIANTIAAAIFAPRHRRR